MSGVFCTAYFLIGVEVKWIVMDSDLLKSWFLSNFAGK